MNNQKKGTMIWHGEKAHRYGEPCKICEGIIRSDPYAKGIIKDERTKLVKEILMFLVKLELQQPEDLKKDNWRNWKYIRNSIVDEYNIHHNAGK